MTAKRTDLALEAHELWRESAGETTELPGVKAENRERGGFPVTEVRILNEDGSNALEKPVGTYVTMEIDQYLDREEDAFARCAKALSEELSSLLALRGGETVLVAGLGNDAITPDSIGPRAMRQTLATRHLVRQIPDRFGALRSVSVLETGVLASTGVESAEMIRAVTEKLRPGRVIVVDALASRSPSRLCRTLQLTDAGIVPGSGVGNSRSAINRETLGIPVICIGAPTVVDAATLAADLIEQSGGEPPDPEKLAPAGGGMIVTPREIDSRAADLGRLIGCGINLALQPELKVSDIAMLLS
ncbi:MAG: GPR endopeptidase [Oscillospiraceae bacterium]|nr:GPR endopeptidase [Oscillospiraceae bacterium]